MYYEKEEQERSYCRSVVFLLIMAIQDLYPDAEVIVRFSVNKGLYCDVTMNGEDVLNESIINLVEKRMREIISENLPIAKKSLLRADAVKLFKGKQSRQIAKANLIAALPQERVSIYFCDNFYDYLYGNMVKSTGEIDKFELEYCKPGVLIRTPDGNGVIPRAVNQPKLMHTLYESKKWASILNCAFIPDLNRHIQHGKAGDIIRVSEALQEKNIAEIADAIAKNINHARLILIAGPSSSGKTSFAQRLNVQLKVHGLKPISISIDDYFVDRVDTPLTPDGKYDYESIAAVDVNLFNENIVALLKGEEAMMPRYSFITGNRDKMVGPIIIGKNQPIIVEGIHGLNEKLTTAVPRDEKFKIYVSALTQLNIDAHNRIHTTDARMLRRLVRDYKFRGAGALKTLRAWPDVRAGEENNIFPFQEEADAVFNSALLYELAVLKKYAMPLLQQISEDEPEYKKARQLLDFCPYFTDLNEEDEIPNNSILREFIGKSCFFTSSGELKA